MFCFTLSQAFWREHVLGILVVKIETLTSRMRLFPCRHRTLSLPYVWGDGRGCRCHHPGSNATDTTCTNTRVKCTYCSVKPEGCSRSSGHKHAEPLSRPFCPKCPPGSSPLSLLLLFSTLCSRSPPWDLPAHPDQHSPSPLLSADLGKLLQNAGLDVSIFLSRPWFSGLPEALWEHQPREMPLSSQGSRSNDFSFFHWYLGHLVGYRVVDYQAWLAGSHRMALRLYHPNLTPFLRK